MKQPQRKLQRNELIAMNKKTSAGRHWGRLVILIAVLVVFAIGAYVLRLYGQTRNAIEGTHQSIGESQAAAAIFKQKKPFSLLLLGTDTGAEGRHDQGNSDTMIVATVNPNTKQVLLTSVPRDTMAEIIGTKDFTVAKINATYMYGGSKMSLQTVNKLLGTSIDYYMTINMGGLQKVVDAVGGVDVDVPFAFSLNGSSFTKGAMHLNGKQALDYSRMRYDDPENDYGRQKRQRQIITAVIKSAVSTGTLAHFQEVLKAVTKNMTTNLTFDDMVQIFLNYRSAGQDVKSDFIQGVNATIGGASYQIAPTSELQRVSDKIHQAQGLDTVTLDNEEVRQNKLNANQGFIFDNPTVDQTFTIFDQNSDTMAWQG